MELFEHTYEINTQASNTTEQKNDVLSNILCYIPQSYLLTIADKYLLIERELSRKLKLVSLPELVGYTYCPLEYAFDCHFNFVHRFYSSKKSVLFLGMNPGPFGMSQNGIPFGEVSMVRDWLQIDGVIQRPEHEHPQRPVLGLNCHRKEVSGARFWKLFQGICGSPESFFHDSFVHNHCPVAYMTSTGKNITPPQLPSYVQNEIFRCCDAALRDICELFGVEVIVGIGKYAQDRALVTFGRKKWKSRSPVKFQAPEYLNTPINGSCMDHIRIESMMHPSPRNPAANKGWIDIAMKQLGDIGVMPYLTNSHLEDNKSMCSLVNNTETTDIATSITGDAGATCRHIPTTNMSETFIGCNLSSDSSNLSQILPDGSSSVSISSL